MLKYKRENLEGVDEAHHDLYQEAEGGGFVLKVEGVVPQSKYDELSKSSVKNSTEASRRRQTVERIIEKLGAENAEGIDTAIDALKSSKSKPNEDHEAVVAQLKSEYETKLQEVTGQVSKMRSGEAQSNFKAELAKANFHPEVIDDIAAGSAGRLKFDEGGNLRIMAADGSEPMAGSGAGGFATITDLANELAAAKPSFLKDEGKGGGGKPPATQSGSTSGNSRISEILKDLPVS